MLECAKAFRDAHLHEAATYDDLKQIVEDGWALIYHCGTRECEDKIKEETKATSRCFPLDLNPEWEPAGRTCAVCGKPALAALTSREPIRLLRSTQRTRRVRPSCLCRFPSSTSTSGPCGAYRARALRSATKEHRQQNREAIVP